MRHISALSSPPLRPLSGPSPLLRLRLLQHGLVVLLIHGHRILRLHNPVNQSIPAEPCPFSGQNPFARVTLFRLSRNRHDLLAIINGKSMVAEEYGWASRSLTQWPALV